MSETRLEAAARTEFGKGASRRVRKAGLIPAVLYGHGTDPRHLSLPAREFGRAIRGGANTVLTLAIDGGEELALPKSVVRHPLRDYVEHVDLILVRRGERVTVDVRIDIVGDAAPGTLVVVDQNTLSIEVEALKIPESLEVSIEGLAAGTQISAADVNLPEGATLAADPESLVVGISLAPTTEELEADGAGTESTGAETAPIEGETSDDDES